jgi:hypothetical protein
MKMDIKEVRSVKEKEVCWYQMILEFDNPTGAPALLTLTVPNGEGFFMPNTLLIPAGYSTQFVEFYPLGTYAGGTISIEIHGSTEKGDCFEKIYFHLPELCKGTDRPISPVSLAGHANLMLIAPNPAKDETTIYYEFVDWKSEKHLEIYDVLGRLIFSAIPSNSEKSLTVDCSKFADGTYIAVMTEGGGVIGTQKFVIRND